MESGSRFTVQYGGTFALAPPLRSQNTVPLRVSNPAGRRRIRERAWSPKLGASETERSQRSPSQNDTDVAGWRRVSCWWRRGALGPSSPARRRILAAIRSAPTNHRRRLPATVHCHTQRRTSCWRRSSTPQVDLRMLVAVHGLALRSASDAMRAPSPQLLKWEGCRAPPPSSRRAASARHHQRLARARPRSSRLTREPPHRSC